jgi:RNA polymerase sigma factor (sigma-70 family)
MPTRAERLFRCVRRIASQAGPVPEDSGLLTCFLSGRDPAAFEALVARHGPMVLRVCQHVLGNRHDAEDAFQATFLVLARKAASVRPGGCLASWLHGVACRVALGARTAARRRRREDLAPDLNPPDPRPGPLAELTAREALQILEEEVQRLPVWYRLPQPARRRLVQQLLQLPRSRAGRRRRCPPVLPFRDARIRGRRGGRQMERGTPELGCAAETPGGLSERMKTTIKANTCCPSLRALGWRLID